MSDPDKVEALTEQVAMEYLNLLASAVRPGDAIVELGVYQGASLAYLARGARDHVPVIGVDPWGMRGAYTKRPHMLRRYPPKGQQITEQHLTREGVIDKVCLIRGLSTTVADHWPAYSLAQVGLLFIDAVHREKEVLEDFRAWLPHLTYDATVAFDDHDEKFDGVRRAVARLVDEGELVWGELVGSRLAVLRRPSANLIQNNPSQGARENGRESK